MNKPLAVTLLLLPLQLIVAESIDWTVIYAQSSTIQRFQKTFPNTKLVISDFQQKDGYTELTVYENHPTHLVRLANLRVFINGDIERLAYDHDGNEHWLSDNIVTPK